MVSLYFQVFQSEFEKNTSPTNYYYSTSANVYQDTLNFAPNNSWQLSD